MKLGDLNWKKLVGKEAIQQGTWDVTTSDGQQHTIWAGMKVSLAYSILGVQVDGQTIKEIKIWVNLGSLADFELGEDRFQVKQGGWGLAGKLVLSQNGRELGKAEAQAVAMTSGHQTAQTEIWETWVEEAERFSEPLGEERREIDNSLSGSQTVRKITVSRQWVQKITLNEEKATELQGSLNVKVPLSIGLSGSAKQTIKRNYAVSEESTRTYTEEVTITVLPKTRSNITFRWRQVWQRGLVVGRNDKGTEVRIPFEVKLHPTFDQSQEDVGGEEAT